jgi:hypothetical protein
MKLIFKQFFRAWVLPPLTSKYSPHYFVLTYINPHASFNVRERFHKHTKQVKLQFRVFKFVRC